MTLASISIGLIGKYLFIAYIVGIALYALGKFTYFFVENVKAKQWKVAMQYAVLILLDLFVAWVCLSPYGFNFGPLPSLTDTAAFKWIVDGSIGIKWSVCAKALGALFIGALWIVFAAIWRVVFKRASRIRDIASNKPDKIAIGVLAVICAATAAAAVWISNAIWSVTLELVAMRPDQQASLGEIILVIFFALMWTSAIANLGVATHKCVVRGKKRDFVRLALSAVLVGAVCYISWAMVPTF